MAIITSHILSPKSDGNNVKKEKKLNVVNLIFKAISNTEVLNLFYLKHLSFLYLATTSSD